MSAAWYRALEPRGYVMFTTPVTLQADLHLGPGSTICVGADSKVYADGREVVPNGHRIFCQGLRCGLPCRDRACPLCARGSCTFPAGEGGGACTGFGDEFHGELDDRGWCLVCGFADDGHQTTGTNTTRRNREHERQHRWPRAQAPQDLLDDRGQRLRAAVAVRQAEALRLDAAGHQRGQAAPGAPVTYRDVAIWGVGTAVGILLASLVGPVGPLTVLGCAAASVVGCFVGRSASK